ncbi:dTDP-4-dehydrorhamnose reductase [Candidatus Endolissoclinum faulkneri L2]|uniref:dTDP-4-dehydrorhamnose reductase n=1 Tax=Candidatus Endolissoclinum faulkneri L2 TaxID=1193729 RepID=K7ZD02_9PROT|nr:dTDP-4-dehydrorhamnose reductase [Candidatus Endolissoclinum faulkneri]AFX99046.1 dTDP-4-dehydrorhamnose reductase [Candidatus Endolissoclinum faulkneri L2]
MRILITGAAGQVGGALLRLDNKKVSEGIKIIGLNKNRLDITRIEMIDHALDLIRPDLIVNAAAYTSVDAAEQAPEQAFLVNRQGPAYLAAACDQRCIQLIHISTNYVFSGKATQPYLPSNAVSPLNVYGASKEAGENAVRNILVNHIILRTAWVYDAYSDNFMNTMLRISKERTEARVVADQYGTPTTAIDVAFTIMAIIRAQMNAIHLVPGTYHYTNEGKTTWYGFAQAIFDRAEKCCWQRPKIQAISTFDYPKPAKRPLYSVLKTSSQIDALPNVPHRSWQLGLDEVFAERMTYKGDV